MFKKNITQDDDGIKKVSDVIKKAPLQKVEVKTQQKTKKHDRSRMLEFAIEEIHGYVKDMETVDEDTVNRLAKIFEVSTRLVIEVHKNTDERITAVTGKFKSKTKTK